MSSPQKVTKAVIAAAGFGTRFLPQTKAMPKEMLPLIDKPIIQYVVEDLVAAGIKDIIIVSNYSKRTIEDHFDTPNQDLLMNLMAGGPKKQPYIDQIYAIADMANFAFVRQKGAYGNATPVMSAAHLIGDEPFIYTFADDFFASSPSRTTQMIAAYNEFGGSILACKKVLTDDEYDKYGIAGGDQINDSLLKVNTIVEKPGKANAPSDSASVSGYLLEPAILDYITRMADQVEEGTEFNIQPAMQAMINDGHVFHALQIQNGKFHDTGNKLEYLKTVIEFGIAHEEMGPELIEFLRKKLQ
jgi:UTP--glucose-1-phosphate uridylyltransferase